MLKAAVGHSIDPDSQAAIAEVLAQCDRQLAGARPVAGILLAAIDFDCAGILQTVVAAYPGIELIGGTSDGEISSVLGFEQDSLTLVLFCSDRLALRATIARHLSQDMEAAIGAAIAQAQADLPEPIALCIALPESLTVSAAQVVDCLRRQLGDRVPICGGLTADPWLFQRTQQFCGTEVQRDAVALLLFAGPLLLSHGVASGWTPMGKPGIVTKARGNVVYEIDEQPALAFYQRYLQQVEPAPEYPLAVFTGDNGSHFYLRAPSGVCDRDSGSVTFFGDLPEGAIVQISQATRDGILSASAASAQTAMQQYPGREPAVALFFSCASRRQILGSRTGEEYQRTQQSLPVNLPSCGFYTNGEIAPLEQQAPSWLHNETFITLLMGED